MGQFGGTMVLNRAPVFPIIRRCPGTIHFQFFDEPFGFGVHDRAGGEAHHGSRVTMLASPCWAHFQVGGPDDHVRSLRGRKLMVPTALEEKATVLESPIDDIRTLLELTGGEDAFRRSEFRLGVHPHLSHSNC